MTERIQSDPEYNPVEPEWSIRPREHEQARPGRPPFDILYIPEDPRLIALKGMYFNQEGLERLTDANELEERISVTVAARKQAIEERNTALERDMSSQGASIEDIEAKKTLFFDKELARLHPKDFEVTGDGGTCFRLGRTTYFTYAGSRSRESLETFGYDRLGLPLAVCSISYVETSNGTTQLLYTVRSTKNETYAGWYHGVGGTVQLVENGIADPKRAQEKEIIEETGLTPDEFEVKGALGIVLNNFDIHPEIAYINQVYSPLEQWYATRETDEEVGLRFFTDTASNLEKFILGQPFSEVPDSRPIVPSGLFGFLAYGRIRYGEQWFRKVLNKLPQY
jgi:hypothetical protein